MVRAPGEDVQKLVQELQVHQVELEMQNDELRRTEQALEAALDRYTELYMFSPSAQLTLTADGEILEANVNAGKLLGLERGKLIHQKLSRFVQADEQDTLYLFCRQVFRSASPHSTDLDLVNAQGNRLAAHVEAVYDAPHHPKQRRFSLTDVTERKRAEAALQQSEKELANFFHTSPIGLLWVKPDGHILRVNDAELELLGCTSKEVLSRPVSRFHVDPAHVADLLHRLAKGETIRNYHQCIRQKDRSITHVLIDANGLWENDQLIYSRWFVRDITRRVELEGEILRMRDREQMRLGHDLHEDLCQQLVGISLLAETLAKSPGDDSSAFAAKAKEIAQLVKSAMSQTREMAAGLSPVPLEAEGLMEALKTLAARTKKVFHIDCHFQCEKPVLVSDHTVGNHLYRIALEAVGNALKHGKAQRIDIGLTANGKNVVLVVGDNGLGIPVTKSNHKGMGLRIMQYRIGVIGGSLLVQRNPNGGTTVVCTVSGGLMPSTSVKQPWMGAEAVKVQNGRRETSDAP
jgi:PAS domain S-box-containing protein